MTHIPCLALSSALYWLSEVCRSAHNNLAVCISFRHLLLEVLFGSIHFKGWLIFTIRQLRYAIPVATYTNKRFCIAVPGRNIFIANRPVDTMTIFQVCFK